MTLYVSLNEVHWLHFTSQTVSSQQGLWVPISFLCLYTAWGRGAREMAKGGGKGHVGKMLLFGNRLLQALQPSHQEGTTVR